MDPVEELDQHGRALLAELVRDPESACWRQFDALFYEVVWKYLRANHDKLSARVARYLKLDGVVAPEVMPEEVDEVAHEATKIALRRVRQKAGRFDPARGTPTKWVIGSAEYAYIEVAKTLVAARRSDRLQFVAPDDLLDEPDAMSTDEHVLRHLSDEEALEDAASQVSEKEWIAIRLVVTADQTSTDLLIDIVPKGSPIVATDIDGTLTESETAEYPALLKGELPNAQPRAADALAALAGKGYHPVYLTARPEWLTGRTKEFLAKHGFPPGIVRTTTGLTGASGAAAAAFKAGELALLQRHGHKIEWAFGNHESDGIAYAAAKINPINHRVFLQFTDTRGGRRIASYVDIVPQLYALPAACQ